MSGGGDRYFADTNLLLYANDPRPSAKKAQAERWIQWLWQTRSGNVSWQVLHEFYTNVRKIGLSQEQARDAVRSYQRWRPADTSPGLVERAWEWMDTAQTAYWDALIVAAAELGGCRWLLSEDFQAGRRFGEVTVVNPFDSEPAGL